VLPADLPPSHRGRAAKFSYRVVAAFHVSYGGAGSPSKPRLLTMPPASGRRLSADLGDAVPTVAPGSVIGTIRLSVRVFNCFTGTEDAPPASQMHETDQSQKGWHRDWGFVERGLLLPFNLRVPFCSDPLNALTYCEEERAQLRKLKELQLARHASVTGPYAHRVAARLACRAQRRC